MAVTAVLTFNKDGDPLLVAPGDVVGFNLTVANDTGSAVTITTVEPYIATSAGVRTTQYPITVGPVNLGPGASRASSPYGNYTETLSSVATGRYFKFTKAAGTSVLTQNGSPLFRTDRVTATAYASDSDWPDYVAPSEAVLDVVAATTGSNVFPFTVTVGKVPVAQGATFTFNVGCIVRFSSEAILAASEIPVIVTRPTLYNEGGLDASGNHVTPVVQTPLS